MKEDVGILKLRKTQKKGFRFITLTFPYLIYFVACTCTLYVEQHLILTMILSKYNNDISLYPCEGKMRVGEVRVGEV